ncbi:MAG TPA: hypothetical protein VHI78_03915 [Bacteroidales bacterium]|jgi:hypothetical protein|nr:hypothetical protein [Bacteroidales bacterium]
MKKSVIVFFLSFAVLFPLCAQVERQSLYQHKVEVYTRMKNAGWTMTGFGGGLVVTGTIFIASLPGGYWDYEDDLYYESNGPVEEDVKVFAGFTCIGLGIGLLAGGITMGSIGTHKVRQYKSKLDNLSIAPVITPNVQGLTLVLRF